MKINEKGFTLIELLAVIIILGVIMTIAVPNVLSMLDKNKKDTFIEHAKLMANQAEYAIRKDTTIEYPTKNNAIIMTLEYLNTEDISESPYNTMYSPSQSFVAIVNYSDDAGVTEYKYYVHLVACNDLECTNNSNEDIQDTRGINLINVDELTGSSRFLKVKRDVEVEYTLGSVNSENKMTYENDILSMLDVANIEKVYNKLP